MKKIPKQAYTTEFKALAVKRVKGGESISVVVKELGLGDQTLRNWVKAESEGMLKGAGSNVVTPGGDGIVQIARRKCPTEAGERHHKKGSGVLREGCSVKYAWM